MLILIQITKSAYSFSYYYFLYRGETVSLLLETILTGEKLESSIVGGIQVLLVLLGQRANKYAQNIL